MNNYNIYLLLKSFKKEFYSNLLKSLISFFYRLNNNIVKIIDFGNFFFIKSIKRLFYININCKKKCLKKVVKLFKIKKDIIYNFLIIKINLNLYLINFCKLKNFLNRNFKLFPSILSNTKFKIHKIYSKIIKNLKKIKLIPIDFINYIKKINFFI